jgi:hypothetical protein
MGLPAMVLAGGLAKKLLLAVNALVVVAEANSTKRELAREDEDSIIMVGGEGTTRHYNRFSVLDFDEDPIPLMSMSPIFLHSVRRWMRIFAWTTSLFSFGLLSSGTSWSQI